MSRLRNTLALGTVMLIASEGARAQNIRLECAAFTSGGAFTADGTILVLGQPFIGLSCSVPPILCVNAGLVPCLAECAADVNYDGAINSQDFFNFLTAFFQQEPEADFNADGAINSQDFFDFLAAFFEGC
jgi:hypothetical protein